MQNIECIYKENMKLKNGFYSENVLSDYQAEWQVSDKII